MPSLHIIYDPSDMDLKGIPADLANKRGVRQAKISIPDGEFDGGDIDQSMRQLVELLRLKE